MAEICVGKNIMNKRLTTLMTTLILSVFFSISASAYDLEADGIYYTIISDKTKTVEVSKNKVKLYTGKVSIPSSITKFGETYTVTRIGLSCFRDCDKIYCTELSQVKIHKRDLT